MLARPLVGVYNNDKKKIDQHVSLPAVFTVPIRPDLVNDVHARMQRNRSQPYAVSKYAGHQSSAESWGTGRAVARIPRVPGGGTSRAGQGAFGNMCRGGRMFGPTKIWRKWHRKINVSEKRYALTSALSASAVPALVMARGHRVEGIPEIPLVIDNKTIDNVDKSKKALTLLKSIGAYEDVQKSKDSRHIRAGKGKWRNRRYVQRKGPLVIYNEKGPLVKAFRNLPGVDVINVNRLNLLQLAPGGHLGRFCIWAKDAFEKLDAIYGTYKTPSTQKVDYKLPRPIVSNPDIARLINSDEIQTQLRLKKTQKRRVIHGNPLKNAKLLQKLNPYGYHVRRSETVARLNREKKKAALLEAKRTGKPVPAEKPKAKKNAKNAELAKKRQAFLKAAHKKSQKALLSK